MQLISFKLARPAITPQAKAEAGFTHWPKRHSGRQVLTAAVLREAVRAKNKSSWQQLKFDGA